MLTKRQERFCQEYVASGNAGESARKAGYIHSEGKPRAYMNTWACRLKKMPKVAARIEELEKEAAIRLGITHEYVLQNLKDIAEATKINDPRAATNALELLGKHLKLFTEKSELQVTNPIQITLTRGKE